MATMRQRVIKLLLQRTFGSLLEKPLDAEQLGANFAEGFVELNDIELSSQMLRRCLEGIPAQLVSARASKVRVNIPSWWSSAEDSSVEVTGLDVRLEPAEAADTGGGTHPIDLQSSFREGEADGAAWGSDGVAHPETSQEELTRQQDTDTQLKRLLLETELTLKHMRVTLQAPPPQDGAVHLPALSLAFDELTVCNAAGADGNESAGVDGVHEFRKRLGVLGLRLELSVVDRSGVLGAPAALVCRDGTWDSVDVAVRRNTDAQGGSTTVDLRADVGGIRAAIAPVHCDALATLHSQFLKTAAGWAPAPIAAMRGLAASALSVSGSLMSGSFGDHDDQQLNTAATDLSLSLHESLVDIAGTIRESVWVWNAQVRCRRASLTLLYGAPADYSTVEWLAVPPGLVAPPSLAIDGLTERNFGHVCLVIGHSNGQTRTSEQASSSGDSGWGACVTVHGDAPAESGGWATDLSVSVSGVRVDEYLSKMDGACEYGRAIVSCAGHGEASCLGSSIFFGADEPFVQNNLFRFADSARARPRPVQVKAQSQRGATVSGDSSIRYCIDVEAFHFAIDTGLPSRLAKLDTTTLISEEGLPQKRDMQRPGRGAKYGISLRCPLVVGELHVMLPHSVTPCVEFLRVKGESVTLASKPAQAGWTHFSAQTASVDLVPFAGRPVNICNIGTISDGSSSADHGRFSIQLVGKRGVKPQPAIAKAGIGATRSHRGECMNACATSAKSSISVSIPTIAAKLSDEEYCILTHMVGAIHKPMNQAEAPQHSQRIPEPELQHGIHETVEQPSGADASSQEAFVCNVLSRLASHVLWADSLHVVVYQGNLCLHGQSTVESEDVFQPYDESSSDEDADSSNRYAYELQISALNFFRAAGHVTGSEPAAVSTYTSVNVDNITIIDQVQRRHIVQTVAAACGDGSVPAVAVVVDIVCQADHCSTVLVESMGLRLQPGWKTSVEDQDAIMPSLNLSLPTHLQEFFASDGQGHSVSHGRQGKAPQYLYMLLDCSIELSAPFATSAALLHVGRTSVSQEPIGQFSDIRFKDATLQLIDDRDAVDVSSRWMRGGGSCVVALLPELAVSAQFAPHAADGSGGHLTKLTCTTPEDESTSPALVVQTCGDSCSTLLHFYDEVCDALNERQIAVPLATGGSASATAGKTPHRARGEPVASPAQGRPRSAVFKDSQEAWIAVPEPEPEPIMQDLSSVQMEPVVWSQTPVIVEDYMPEVAVDMASQEAVTRSASTDSSGFVDLGTSGEHHQEAVPPPECTAQSNPAAVPPPMDASEEDSGADVPQRKRVFDATALQNLIESYIDFDGNASDERSVDQRPTSTRAVPTPQTSTLQIAVSCPGLVKWQLFTGHDWVKRPLTANISSRGSVFVEGVLNHIRCTIDNFSGVPDGQCLRKMQFSCREFNVIDKVSSSRIDYLVTAKHTPGRQRDSSSCMIRLHVDAFRATQAKVRSVAELLNVKLQLTPLQLGLDGGTLRRLAEYFHSDAPAVQPRPDDALFQLAEIGGVVVQIDYITDSLGVQTLRDFPLAILPVKIRSEGGAPLAGLPEYVWHLWKNEIMRELPGKVAEAVSNALVTVRPIGSLARVGVAAADVVRAPIKEYRKSQNVEYAMRRGIMTEMPKLVKTVVFEAADTLQYAADVAKAGLELGLESLQSGRADPAQVHRAPHAHGATGDSARHQSERALQAAPSRQSARAQPASDFDAAVEAVRGVRVAVLRPLIGVADVVSEKAGEVKNALS